MKLCDLFLKDTKNLHENKGTRGKSKRNEKKCGRIEEGHGGLREEGSRQSFGLLYDLICFVKRKKSWSPWK